LSTQDVLVVPVHVDWIAAVRMSVPVGMPRVVGTGGGLAFGAQHAAHLRLQAAGVEELAIEELRGVDRAVDRDQLARPGVERLQPGGQAGRGARVGEVGLGEHQAVGDRGLAHRLGVPVELGLAVQRVHRGHQPGSRIRQAMSGSGSASPVVSMATRSKGGSVPASFS
jgi:hypothetical protein